MEVSGGVHESEVKKVVQSRKGVWEVCAGRGEESG